MIPDEGTDRFDLATVSLHALVQKPRQRRILHCLLRADGPIHVADLAALLTRIDARSSRLAPTDEEIQSTAIRLYHTHLPRLETTGLVSVDPESRLVTVDLD